MKDVKFKLEKDTSVVKMLKDIKSEYAKSGRGFDEDAHAMTRKINDYLSFFL